MKYSRRQKIYRRYSRKPLKELGEGCHGEIKAIDSARNARVEEAVWWIMIETTILRCYLL